MDGSHSKDTIPLEPEGYRRSEKNFTVHFGQLFLDTTELTVVFYALF